ncbi:TAP-like protein [Amycolatopsis sulphurea]|uniref:TAP-like protein n=1 Tax=Amycolatopsis sulphurea TaxID=76022 RepID=A0A2A9FBQ9_9PSEU|nr:alpha/beta hydrolase [Amycolatopsis sulphurea]PFG47930.1 TAP-like protein [Amycolatopsis sulphurea]
MRRTLPVALAVAGLATAMLPAVSQAATPSGGVRWGACPADVAKAAPDLQCATLQVPLDYRNPDGKRIELGISRLPSTNPAHRKGVLLTDPGGPAPGMTFPADLVKLKLPKSVRDSYDVIGFDPRGFGHSTPVSCDLTHEQSKYGIVPTYARNTADVLKTAADAKQIAKQCLTGKSAWMRPYISTANSARDLNQIRIALGESQISYLGVSWGSYLGAVYTTLFPEQGGRFVVDSNLSEGGWTYPYERLYGQGFQDRLPDFAKFAAAGDAKYHLGSTPAQVTAKYYELADRLDRKPNNEIDGKRFRYATFATLFSDKRFDELAQAWHELDAGVQIPPGAPGDLAAADNMASGELFTTCNDSRWPTSVGSYVANVAVDHLRYPAFGGAGANIQPCAFWPDPAEPPVRIGDKGPLNVLMTQNLRDPVTPLAGALRMRQALGERARMVTADHGGHGTYLVSGNQCVTDVVTTFLTTGRRPAQDMACKAETH